MGHPGFNRQWARPDELGRRQRRGRGRGPWGDLGGWDGPGRQGPPPWVAGLFGLGQPADQRRGPRARRGDVRSAILDVLRASAAAGEGEQVNGYQVIQQISERSQGAWRPSPGSVYPTIQQLQDEGLVAGDDERGRRTLSLTAEGEQYVADHADELVGVWRPFEREAEEQESTFAGVKPEIGRVMGAVWQIATSGSEAQQRAAVDVLVETRRKLYGILADGDEGLEDAGADEDAES